MNQSAGTQWDNKKFTVASERVSKLNSSDVHIS